MFFNRKFVKTRKKYLIKLRKQFLSIFTKRKKWLLRAFLVSGRQPNKANAGFVLPTVAMVSLVVVLLTTAILFRSFERSKNASNVRVNQVVLQAATPALDRARAKISELFADPTLPRAVPSNSTLYNTIINKLEAYTLGDEIPLTLAYDIGGAAGILTPPGTPLEDKETMETAWKFPADTDNNGKFDSFILYGIYFRNPTQTGNNPTRKRIPLEARTPPQGSAGSACDTTGQTSASLVGNSGWYKQQTGELKKSFFVYVVTVPITSQGTLDTKYEEYKGNKGFSALELQQDRSQLPLTNNAVVYEDDLDITPGPVFRLNGRIITNSNLLIGKSSQDITLFQVSSKESCYYEQENAKIIVGGNVAGNGAISSTDRGEVGIHLYLENGEPSKPSLSNTTKSTSNAPNQVAYNSQAYAERIDLLVTAQLSKNSINTNNDPQEVYDNIRRRTSEDASLNPAQVRREELEIYFRKRTRRVPFIEVAYRQTPGAGRLKPGSTTDEYTVSDVLQGYNASGRSNDLRPPDAWISPADANTGLTITASQLQATDPTKLPINPIAEPRLGDRILVGNNLPELRWEGTATSGEFVGESKPQQINSTQTWTGSTNLRTRTTRVRQLADLGVTGRDGFWEKAAAAPKNNFLDVVGGLRVVTGAGIYRRTGSFMTGTAAPPTPQNNPNTSGVDESTAPVVWSDAMPMLGYQGNDPSNPLLRGDLVMRATAVYHFNDNAYNPGTPTTYQTPIACVSSYYNPTSSTTAAASNNGVSYAKPSTTATGITRPGAAGLNANGLFTTTATAEDVTNTGVALIERLKYQANLVFPNGRLVNPLLRQALIKPTTNPLTLSEQAAIDSTICAIAIADGSLATSQSVILNDTIKETTFLDGREIKAIDKPDSTTGVTTPTGKYDLEIEQRQPLEIRATVIDLEKLRTKAITGTWSSEYLLPNSGIIYASRDDAQADASSPSSASISATDYRLDPNRRPNAIMLINGGNLSRQNSYRVEEKGLTLATNLPVYIQGDFNKHTKQEFKDAGKLNSPADWDTNFYTRLASNRDPDFACRPSDARLPNCTVGETWRPASVIADAVTLLSSKFREGYRNEGDYDLRNNQIDVISNTGNYAKTVRDNRQKVGLWDNNFVTSATFTVGANRVNVEDSYYSATPVSTDLRDRNSSYLNNFVTPVQRRATFFEYAMEMCFKLPVSECGTGDWYVGLDADGNPATTSDFDTTVKSSGLPVNVNRDKLLAGTTAIPPKPGFERFARRVAFKRNSTGQLLNSSGTVLIPASDRPIPLGILSNQVNTTGSTPSTRANALWFTTTTDAIVANPLASTKKYNNTASLGLFYQFPSGADEYSQPLLEPILQIHIPRELPNNDTYSNLVGLNTASRRVKNSRWLPQAVATEVNLAIAAGDTPARVSTVGTTAYEINGGLQNFVRFLENWDTIASNINGSFIQFKRSFFATAPFQAFVRTSPSATPPVNSLFTDRQNIPYHSDSTFAGSSPGGEAPYYVPPIRNWGFDVALLSQNPDLFAQRFVVPSGDAPNEYFREVSRDDRWVQTLMCAAQSATNGFDTATDYGTNMKYALPTTERPPTCPVAPD
jgi:hypothetical protein